MDNISVSKTTHVVERRETKRVMLLYKCVTQALQGVFPHKGSYRIGDKRNKVKGLDYVNELWYLSYKETWTTIQKTVENIQTNMFQQILTGLESFILKVKDTSSDSFENEIPAAILLTGVNVPDHAVLFKAIISKLEPITKHIATIWSRDSNNIKSMMEETIYQLINSVKLNEESEIRKGQCTMRILTHWYEEYCEPNDPLVIIIADFESSSAAALHDFISILSSYSNKLKFVLVFGVATTLHAIHRSLSYDVTSKLNVKVFHMQTQVNILSDVLESTVFCSEIPFKLTGRAFQLLTDIFLFYDFSVENFLQSYKMCMIQHFYDNNVNILCCRPKDIKERISALTEEDIQEIRKIPSIEKHMQNLNSTKSEAKSLESKAFKDTLGNLLNQFHRYMDQFFTVLKCLHHLTATLPNSPLGKQLRELYTKAVYTRKLTETEQYKECLQLLGFLSKRELLTLLESVVTIIKGSKDKTMKSLSMDLRNHIKTIEESSLEVAVVPADIVTADEKLSRAQVKEKLFKMSQKQSRSPYKQAQIDLINYLDQKVFSVHLINPNQVPTYEIFCFSDGNLAKQHIRGSLRAAIHTGLSDPQLYLNCECCKLENDDAIPSTLPDLSIIYKLHLESRKLINMYDWLQAFLIIVDPSNEPSEQRDVDPKLQARFTQAVAELEFLGFIKTSRKKRDHVKRLT